MTYDRNIRAYQETDLQTMSKEKLIVLLYRKMLEHLDVAAKVAASDRVEMSRRLSLTQRIVSELRGALDHDLGGDIAANLDSIYDFVFIEILSMQVDRNPAHSANCQQALQPLLNAWSEIPSGTGDRELCGAPQAGTNPASPKPMGPTPETGPTGPSSQRFSFSA